ncbi:glycosyltransferase family 2 protein [Lewinella sp. IMCC34191]|uniref:glycosyltransferase family 2 protein n=1 Tax=Lewinella sp. IMCC34191 TaxID=2259172 RepID=UPI000E25E592|nr:glycosyltransferase family 2 protein [Lewinella sp. IMCC34191]
MGYFCIVPAATVIVSTYNQPEWLRKTLWSLEVQDSRDFEVVIADDGSGQATAELITEAAQRAKFPLRHVWHEDTGFRKTEILNRAIQDSQSDYLIFTDGDCLLRRDFVATHLKRRRPGHFLSGGYYKLVRDVSERVTRSDIVAQRCFDTEWLHAAGQPSSLKDLKLTRKPWLAGALNRLTPTRPTWNGHNASTWKAAIVAANGFDTRMKYGGEDREFGDRLLHAGLRAVQIRYSAICVHLDHDRGYVTPEMVAANRKIWDRTRQEKRQRTAYGITSE